MGMKQGLTSIMMTVMEIVRRVTPPMKEAAPMRAKAPGSIQDHMLGGRNTPGGALQCRQAPYLPLMLQQEVFT